MDLDEDPFPQSLPHIDGPRIFDTNIAKVMEESGLQYDAMVYDLPNYFSAPYQSLNKSYGSHTMVNPADLALSTTQSPESLPDSSSSDSSNKQHKRNHSSNSSRSGLLIADGDGQTVDSTPPPNGILIGASPIGYRGNDQLLSTADFERSNRAMERHFDFDSAASSPSPHLDTKQLPGSSLATPTMNPLRSNPHPGFMNGIRQLPTRSQVSGLTSAGRRPPCNVNG